MLEQLERGATLRESLPAFGLSIEDEFPELDLPLTPHIIQGYYDSIRWFRIGHPGIAFFRCWRCDLNLDIPERPPLMPPERFAHSTLCDAFLLGRRPNYRIREQLEEQQIPIPQPGDFHRSSLQSAFPLGGKPSPEMMQQIQQLSMQAARNDQMDYDRRMSDYYRQVQEQRERINQLPRRPPATDHSPCPNCGVSFPFVLRPNMDDRYSKRTPDNYNYPMTDIEYLLDGAGISWREVNSLSANALERRKLPYWYEECGLAPNIFSLLGVSADG